MWKTPTYGHLLVDILQGIAKRIGLLQVAGESVNPLIWTCLKIRHAGPQGWKSPKTRQSGNSVLASRGECGSGCGCVWEDPTPGTHRQNPPRQSELRGFMFTSAFMNLSLSQNVSPTPTPMSAEIRDLSAPQPTLPHWERRGKKLRHSSVSRTIPSKPIHPLPSLPFPGKWRAFSLCLCIKVHQNGLCSEKRLGEPKYIHCFKDFCTKAAHDHWNPKIMLCQNCKYHGCSFQMQQI